MPEALTAAVPADPLRTPLRLEGAAARLLLAATATSSSSSSSASPSAVAIGGGDASVGAGSSGGSSGGGGPAVMKVNQVDAAVLDGELLDLLRLQLGGILAPPFFPPGFMDRCVGLMAKGQQQEAGRDAVRALRA